MQMQPRIKKRIITSYLWVQYSKMKNHVSGSMTVTFYRYYKILLPATCYYVNMNIFMHLSNTEKSNFVHTYRFINTAPFVLTCI